MKKLALAVLALVGFASVNAKTAANAYYVTWTPNGFKVVSLPPENCSLGNDIACQILVDGTYNIGATIPSGTPFQTLERKPL